MVTRTVKSTKCLVMCVDVVNGNVIDKEVTVPRTYKDKQELLKVVQKVADSDILKCVNVKSFEVIEGLAVMSEADFLKYAEIKPPRNAKTEE